MPFMPDHPLIKLDFFLPLLESVLYFYHSVLCYNVVLLVLLFLQAVNFMDIF